MTNKTKWLIALITLATIALAGIGVAAQSKDDASFPVGSEWALEGTEITLVIEDGRISGSAGCNRYFVEYEVKGNELSTGMIASTEMACEGERMTQEMEYLSALSSVSGFEVGEDTLRVFYDDGQEVLNFIAFCQLQIVVE